MKNNMIAYILFSLIGSSILLFAQKDNVSISEKNYTKVITLDKGVKRTLLIPKEDALKSSTAPYSAKQATAKQGIVIRFKKPAKVDMEAFTAKYGLKLHTKLVIGYYIFENHSAQSDIELLNTIMKHENNIETIKPNWPKNKQPY